MADIRSLDDGVATSLDSELHTAAPKSDYIADGVMPRMRPLRARQIETRQDRQLDFVASELAAFDQQLPDRPVEFAPLFVGGAHHKRSLASLVRAQIIFGDRPVAIRRRARFA